MEEALSGREESHAAAVRGGAAGGPLLARSMYYDTPSSFVHLLRHCNAQEKPRTVR